MGIEDEFRRLRKSRLKAKSLAVPNVLQGISKARIQEFLAMVDLGGNREAVDAVFALLDDETPSFFTKVPAGTTFAAGATTAHLGAHIGILQRGKVKLDREGRDYWIKPLREIGAVEAVTLAGGAFVQGHIVPKSGNSAYRLARDFMQVLQASSSSWKALATKWAADDEIRRRRALRAEIEAVQGHDVGGSHRALISNCVRVYAPRHLSDYDVIYIDDKDGSRVSEESKQKLAGAGVTLTLADAYPDVLLWNQATDKLWVIEAVTSDGEVDVHKTQRMVELAKRCGKAGVNFTTAYATWKDAAARQSRYRNIAPGTYIWIADDPGKALWVTSVEENQAIETVPLPRRFHLE